VDSQVKSFEEIGPIETAGTVIERVELKRDSLQITLNLRALLTTDQFPEGGANLRMTRPVPMQMKRRGVETRLVIPGEAVAASRTDPALLRALARGYQWFGELASGKAASTRQIAAREGLSHSKCATHRPVGSACSEGCGSNLRGATSRYPFGRTLERPCSSPDRMGRAAAFPF
jgi:hypothetical protein